MALYIPQINDVVSQNPPKFFKIIIDPGADAIRIPVEFMKRFGQELPDNVFMKAPGGSPWEVDVIIKPNGESWLHNGWTDFKDHYAIKYGHMLVFAYNGDSVFDVTIFDATTTEIEYNLFNANSNTSSMLITHEELQKVSNKGKGKTYETAQAFMAENISPESLSFVCLLQHSSTAPRYHSGIPIDVARKIKHSGHQVVKFHDSSGRTWLAKCSFRPERGGAIVSGSKEFVEDNDLKYGDACVIEVNKRNKLVWNITTFSNRSC